MFRTVLVSLLVAGFAAVFSLNAVPAAAAEGYRAKAVYSGPYKAERLYQFDAARQTWFASSKPQLLGKLPCSDARTTLETQGEWTGNLTDAGACAGTIEAPRWASGNYLNFLAGGGVASESRKD